MKKMIFVPLALLAIFALIILAAPLSAWDETWEETGEDPSELDFEGYERRPNTTYLHDEAYWPTKLQDPFVDEMMK